MHVSRQQTRSRTLRRSVIARALTLPVVVALGAALPGPADAAASPPPTPTPMPSDAMADVGAPTLSYTGRYVAHIARPRDQVPAQQQVRRTDMVTGASVLLNPAVGGGVANGNFSMPPVISSDGSRVSFSTTASQLVAGDDNGRSDAFVRDATTGETVMASAAFDGGAPNAATGLASLARGGRYVVFTSTATDIVPGSTTPNNDVYRRDLVSGTTVQVSVRPDGSPSRGSGGATTTDASANGNLVFFSSYASDLVAGDTDGELDLFVRNMTTGKTRWLSRDVPAGAGPAGVVGSPNGRWISSRWNDGSLHLTRVSTGETSMVTANGYALLGAFSSVRGELVYLSGGTPYVRQLASGVDTPIPVPAGGFVTNVTVSGNGAYAAYDWNPVDGSPSRIFRVAL
jgi:hypothetical protein